jgi:hypothetical protein
MAMSPSDLTDAIYNEMESVYWPGTPLPLQAEVDAKKYYNTLAKAIINYMKDNVDVLPGTFVAGEDKVTGTGKVS